MQVTSFVASDWLLDNQVWQKEQWVSCWESIAATQFPQLSKIRSMPYTVLCRTISPLWSNCQNFEKVNHCTLKGEHGWITITCCSGLAAFKSVSFFALCESCKLTKCHTVLCCVMCWQTLQWSGTNHANSETVPSEVLFAFLVKCYCSLCRIQFPFYFCIIFQVCS